MLDPSQFKTRNALDGHSIKYGNEQTDFIADEIFTPVYVDKSQAKVYQYDTNHMRDVETRSSTKAEANSVDYGVFTRDVSLELHKLKGDVDPHDEANADGAVADMELDQTENIMSRLLIRRERAMVDLVGDSTNFPSALVTTLIAGETFVDPDGNPELVVSNAKQAVWAKCFKVPNAMAIGFLGLEKLKQSPALKSRLHFHSDRMLTDQEIMALFGVQFLHVCKAGYDSSAKGATSTAAEIWSDFMLLYVKNPSTSVRQVRFGAKYIRKTLYTHVYNDDRRGGVDGRIKVIEKGWEYKLQAGAVVSSSDGDFTAGALIKNIY